MKDYEDENYNWARADFEEQTFGLYFSDNYGYDEATIDLDRAKELRDWLIKAIEEAEKK